MHLKNLKAFYKLLFLLTLEFSQPDCILDMVLYLNRLQALAVGNDSSLSIQHRTALHAIVAGVLYLISKIASASGLKGHILQVLTTRRAVAPQLLPDKFFAYSKDGTDGGRESDSIALDKDMLFILDEEELLKKSPERKKGFKTH